MMLISNHSILAAICLANFVSGQATRVGRTNRCTKGIESGPDIQHARQNPRQKRLGRATKQKIAEIDTGCPFERGSSCRGVIVCRSGPGTRKTMCLEGPDDVENGDECGPCPVSPAEAHKISENDNGCPFVRGSSCRGVLVCRSGPGTRETVCLEGPDGLENGDECGPCPAPTVAPTEAPTEALTTDQCGLIEISVDCSIKRFGHLFPCGDAFLYPYFPCEQPPRSSTMLYNGGNCSQSNPSPYSDFVCEDKKGGPPIEEGSISYIVVTDVEREDYRYFEGFVKVGDKYQLDGGAEEYDADLVITIYGPDGITDASGYLQKVQFSNKCEDPDELSRRFGGSQLVEMTNDLQGSIAMFPTIENVPVSLTVSVSSQNSIILTSLNVLTNFDGPIDLSEQVEGLESMPEREVNLVLPGFSLDSSKRTRYTLLISVNGLVGNLECSATDFFSFYYG